MKIFLAGTGTQEKNIEMLKKSKYFLESFYYIKPWQIELIKCSDMFLLDSGAFTFFKNDRDNDWNEYLERYAEFINENNVDYFFELDIDVITGYDQVLKFRKKLEKMTNKQCIPVWHKQRGFDEFKKMCDEYDYVALGGLAIKEIKRTHYKVLPHLIDEAHKRKAKIHGLGFTSTSYFNDIRFDTVDSTTWINGARFANVCNFNGKNIIQTHYYGKRCIDVEALTKHNFKEWVKFQKYAEKNL